MADWFDKTNTQDCFTQNASARIVEHGQAAKGNPLSENSFIIAVSGLRHEDSIDFVKNKATDQTWDDFSDAFEKLYDGLADAKNHMWMMNFIQKDAGGGENDTNSQIPEVHVHVLSGKLAAGKEYIAAERTFHPDPKQDIYQKLGDEFAENKMDLLSLDMGQGIKAMPLPDTVKEAKTHYVVYSEEHGSFADFMKQASLEQRRHFWKTVSQLALPLVENGGGARIGHYNFNGDVDKKLGCMAVEIAGGQNLGQKNSKHRWFQRPSA